MSTEVIQVRDVPSADAQALRARAASRSMSLSSYLRELIRDDAARPALAEVLGRIASRQRVDASRGETRAFIDDDRRGDDRRRCLYRRPTPAEPPGRRRAPRPVRPATGPPRPCADRCRGDFSSTRTAADFEAC